MSGAEERARRLRMQVVINDPERGREMIAAALRRERELATEDALKEAERLCREQENSWHADEDRHKASDQPGWDEACDYMANRCADAVAALRPPPAGEKESEGG